ncbi:MAG TPA: SGNH/GDSL hydrolase family protein [Solirubrobacteraceae bacterium]
MHRLQGARAVGALIVVFALASLALASGSAMAKASAQPNKPAHGKQKKSGSGKQHVANLPVVPGSQYLALGDSVTFGYMESQVVPAPDYQNAAAFLGYPEQLGAELHLSVANASCPGETSSSLVNVSAPSNGCENNPAHTSSNYRTSYPLHASYRGSQLAFALSYLRTHHNVRLVTLMIGANDFFVCQETTSDSCASTAEQNATAASVTRNIHTILSAVRSKARYEGQIVIVNYYSLNYASPTDNGLSLLLNKVQDSAAAPFHVKIADGYGELEAASVHSGDDTCTAGLLTQIGPGMCGIHPSYAGQALLAQVLEKTIKLS